MRRFQKLASAGMAVLLTTGVCMSQISMHPVTVKAATEVYYEELGLNEKYTQILCDGQFNAYAGSSNGYLLFNEDEGTSGGREASVKNTTVFQYVGTDGRTHQISNLNPDGTTVADAVYGTKTDGPMPYFMIKKNGKYGLMDENGAILDAGVIKWADQISIWSTKNDLPEDCCKYVYEEKVDTTTSNYYFLNQNGNVIVTIKNCNEKKSVSGGGYLFTGTADDYKKLYSKEGKLLYEGSASAVYQSDVWCGVLFNDQGTYTWVNEKKGENVTGKGEASFMFYGYMASDICVVKVVDDQGTHLYNLDMKHQADIAERYTQIKINDYHMVDGQREAGSFLVTTDDYKQNIYRADGTLVSPQDGRVSEYKTEAGGVVYTDEGTAAYLADGRTISCAKLQDQLRQDAVKAFQQQTGIMFEDEAEYDIYPEWHIFSAGILCTMRATAYYEGGSWDTYEYSYLITNESDYQSYIALPGNFCTLEGNSEYQNSTSYVGYELEEGHLTTASGETVNYHSKVIACINLDGEKPVFRTTVILYSENDNNMNSTAFYDEKGTIFEFDLKKGIFSTDANAVATSSAGASRPIIGNTGTYYRYSSVDKRYHIYDITGREIDLNIKTKDYISKSITKGSGNSFMAADLGYILLTKAGASHADDYMEIYTYNGEQVIKKSYDITSGNGNILMMKYLTADKAERYIPVKFIDLCATPVGTAVKSLGWNVCKISEEETILTGIGKECSSAVLKEKLSNLGTEGETVVVQNQDGTELNEGCVGTGSILKVMKEESVVDQATIIVKGDVNGTGVLDVTDMEAVQKDILGISGLTGCYQTAAKVTEGASAISVTDMEAIQKDILGLKSIE